MLPREQGGVVDASLRVYGLANVRVADASVPPIALSTHLMASTYGLAEQASNIIREFYNPKSSTTNASASAGPSRSAAIHAKSNDSSASYKGTSSFQIWAPAIIVTVHVAVALNLFL